MPFMRGVMPIRRTFFYLEQGRVVFRDDVKVFCLGYHQRPEPHQKGAKEFIFWHWAQLQFRNPYIQLVKLKNFTVTPFAMAFLKDGREVLFDLEGKSKDEIVDMFNGTLGKTKLCLQREALESKYSVAGFGDNHPRQCICEIQGQQPCTSLVKAPDYMCGRWRWNHQGAKLKRNKRII
uniref:Small ribosomal subunit protein mS25 n=1 Tax=Acrobeloides nanus TaxID=290746 RepID=A0A914D2W6_9BILA